MPEIIRESACQRTLQNERKIIFSDPAFKIHSTAGYVAMAKRGGKLTLAVHVTVLRNTNRNGENVN